MGDGDAHHVPLTTTGVNMPSRPTLAGTVKLEIGWTGPNAQPARNIMYAFCSNPGDVPTLLAMATNLYDALTSTGGSFYLLEYLSTSWALTSVTAIDNSGTSDNYAQYTATTAGSEGSGAPMSNQVAIGVSWTIDSRYRGGHPRSYIPGVQSTILASGSGSQLAASFITNIQTAANNIITRFNAGTLPGTDTEELGTIRYAGKTGGPYPKFYPFQGALIHPRLDTQRRRLGKEIVVY